MEDMDGDKDLEVLISNINGSVYALRGADGGIMWNCKVSGEEVSSPSFGDVDDDGKPEVIVGSQDANVYALNIENGVVDWTYMTRAPIGTSPALGDVEGDGKLEIVVQSSQIVYTINAELITFSNLNQLIFYSFLFLFLSILGVHVLIISSIYNNDQKHDVEVEQ